MNSPLPKAPHLRTILQSAGPALDKPDQDAEAPIVATPRAPTQAELEAFRAKTQQEANLKALDQRGAAAMNFVRLCAVQRQELDYTDLDFADFREIMMRGDRMVMGGGEISRGFGEPLRVKLSAEVQKALDHVAAVLASIAPAEPAGDPPPSSEEG